LQTFGQVSLDQAVAGMELAAHDFLPDKAGDLG